jgi:BirA family transcriptional regulator, biotin operon repressor / biotin---[acetyl-CoA-carboxylase] ligase
VNDGYSSAAAGFPDPFRLLVRESAASTNDELRALAENGAPDGLVLVAREQTAGRGRRGAAWFAPTGESLAFSILVRPAEPKALWPRLALATGLAVAEAAESFGAAAGIKWPNDVWIGRRKAAGILVEAGRDFVIVGIGINVTTTAFPDGIVEIATSLRLETGMEIALPQVLEAVVRRFAAHRSRIGPGFDEVIAGVRERCVLSGHHVSLTTAEGRIEGRVAGISDSGELLLSTSEGTRALIQADEVRILE